MASAPTYSYGIRVALGIDQLANTILGGWPDETLSARAARCQSRHWVWRWLYIALDTCFHNHCERALASEQHRWQSPPSER